MRSDKVVGGLEDLKSSFEKGEETKIPINLSTARFMGNSTTLRILYWLVAEKTR